MGIGGKRGECGREQEDAENVEEPEDYTQRDGETTYAEPEGHWGPGWEGKVYGGFGGKICEVVVCVNNVWKV